MKRKSEIQRIGPLSVDMSESSGAKANRRRFLKYTGAAAAAVAAGVITGRYAWTPTSLKTVAQTVTRTATLTQSVTETVTETVVYPVSLRAAAEARGILIGSEADEPSLRDARFGPILAREFDSLTPGWEMKWGYVDRMGYEVADYLVRFASDHRMKVKGHCLIWHTDLPAWVNSQMSANDLRLAMQKHIREEVTHYKGKVYAWDVVNEAVDDKEGLRKTVFLEKLGEEYIAEAFQLAHESDPNALLFYNDYDAEAAGGWQKAKSDRVYELVRRLVSEGFPIDGVGLQMHLEAWSCPKAQDVAANIRRLAALGLKVVISEMDVRITDKKLPGTLSERLEVQRRIYHDIIAACLKEKGFAGVTLWGFTDAHSWIDESLGADDPLLFDEHYKPKPAYWGLMDALVSR